MADIWSGDILLPDGNFIKDIGLASQHVTSSPVLPNTNLRFLATVDTARIPLYLAVGPSLDVWTTDETTEAWFEAILLSKSATITDTTTCSNEWWRLLRSQSPIGILVQVQNEGDDLSKSKVTEILFYGTIADPKADVLPTPSSSVASPEHLPELRVHALPLSSHLLHEHSREACNTAEAQFLPSRHDSQSAPTSPKRKRDLFEEATIANRKARGRGGQGVAAAAARESESQQSYNHRKSLSFDTKAPLFSDLKAASVNGTLPRPDSRPPSRSPSISSDTRPLSRKGQLDAHSRRSHLSQVATVPIQPEEPTTESRNKEALSKVVMAAMRMHGLQQRKKSRSRRASLTSGVDESQILGEEAPAEEVAKDDEYKLIYHQTYKGAALALRNHMATKPLHAQPDRLRDVVEKLLTIFLTDPLAQPLPSAVPVDPVATPGSKQRLRIPGSTHGGASPFDLPSIARRPGMMRAVTDSQVFTGSPVSKRRTTEVGPALE